MLENYSDVLNTREIQEILDIKKELLLDLIRTKQLPAFKIGMKKWKCRKEALIDYIINLEKC